MKNKINLLIVCLLVISIFTISCGADKPVATNDEAKAEGYAYEEPTTREANETPTINTMTKDNILDAGKKNSATDRGFIPGDNPVKVASTLRVHVLPLPGNPVLIEDGTFAILFGASNQESGEKVVEYLKDHEIKGISNLIIPSCNPETFMGSIDVIKNMPTFTVSGFNHIDRAGNINQVFKTASANKTFKQNRSAGAIWMENDTTFEVLYPMNSDLSEKPSDSTMVIRFQKGDISFLLTGDIDEKVEQKLLARGKLRPTDIIIATNGATFGSMSESFINAMNPSEIIVGLSGENEELEALPEFAKYISDTGMVVIRSNGKEYSFSPQE